MVHIPIHQLSDEKFQEIYQDEQFRNQVACAHKCRDKNFVFKHFKTCLYPVEYIVTPEQIDLAQAELERSRQEKIELYKNKLVLIGMGMNYEERYEDDVCNWRVRAHFINSKSIHCFIEFGTLSNNTALRIDHAIYRYDCPTSERNNYEGLERDTRGFDYKKANLLQIVNRFFDCDFKEVIIDKYTIPSDHISVSPLKLII
jgi:hypothetical protein